MSLINDALKKAQKQRTGEAPVLHSMPSVGGQSPQQISRGTKSSGGPSPLLIGGIASGVALVLAVGGYFMLRESPKGGGPASPPAVSAPVGSPLVGGPSSTPAQQPTTNNAQPATPAPATSTPSAPAFTLKTEPVAKVETPVSKPEPILPKTEVPKASDQNTQVSPSAVGPAKAEGFRSQVSESRAAPASEPAKPALKLEPRAIQYIEALKVAGIRASATDAKVLMNDRVYRIGSLVEAEMGLKLVDITANSLTFEDERGGRYTRTF